MAGGVIPVIPNVTNGWEFCKRTSSCQAPEYPLLTCPDTLPAPAGRIPLCQREMDGVLFRNYVDSYVVSYVVDGW